MEWLQNTSTTRDMGLFKVWLTEKPILFTKKIWEPIVVTQDMVIVSGHQRVRAAKELNMSTIMVDIRKYENDDKVLKDLIETNIRQRGIGNPNPIKLGRCIKELERIYGVRDGSTNSKGIGVSEKFSFTKSNGEYVRTGSLVYFSHYKSKNRKNNAVILNVIENPED